jgi:hypothetical protein|tara:strand:- start:243 stop:869 length:627 start_codon:yes stop_codon:yes gene_type:complete
MGKYTEQQQQSVLHHLSADNRIRAMRKLAAGPAKNLQSTGHSRWIMETDPNPSAISNKPKGRFSTAQRAYLKGCYWNYAVDDQLETYPVIMSFNGITGPFSEWEVNGRRKCGTRNLKSSHASKKRSAKNLAQYGYCVLSYDDPDKYNLWEEADPHNYQLLLVATATMLAVEKGREFLIADGEETDPVALKESYAASKARMKAMYAGLR